MTGISIAVFCFNVIYLSFYLPFKLNRTVSANEWKIIAPFCVPISAIAGVTCYFSSVFAYWPVYGLLSPFYMFILVLSGAAAISNFG